MDPTELVPCFEGQVSQARELERTLADADIAVTLAKPPPKACCGGSCGCGAKVQVMVQRADLEKVSALFRDEWLQAVQREGTAEQLVKLGLPAVVDPNAEPPCPACGTAAPLVDGACSDCGLQLDH